MGKNGTMIQYFEWYLPDDGNLWQRLKEDAKHLKEIGISLVWMPPATKATGTNDAGYGIYDLYDLGEFDQKGAVRTKYGTKEEYLVAIKALHDQGILAIADIVLNHKAGADESERFPAYEVDPNNRQNKVSDDYEIEGWTKFTFPGRQGKYSEFQWNWNHFSGVDFNQENGKKAIYMIKGIAKGWAENTEVDTEYGNYDYLMNADLDYDHPDVKDEIKRWSEWYIGETGVDGFRLDAVKHIEGEFIDEFIKNIRAKKGDDFYTVGEYWKQNYATLEDYIEDTGCNVDLFDVSLHMNFSKASQSGDSFDMSKIFHNTLMEKNPTIAVTFVDNHDSQPSQALESWVDDWFKPLAYGMILLRESGLPCIFYGDYYGIAGENPIQGKQDLIDKLLSLRIDSAYGKQNDYLDHSNCIGWTREGDKEHPGGMAVLLTNSEQGYKDMYIGKQHARKDYVDYLGNREDTVTINEDGIGRFLCAPGSISVWTELVIKP
ncbi:alpha-amylase [Acetobacterium sp. KB-1]|jgi:alpha-amylase|uniref:alpha-amylase n=1 Tax=Acetobacterium sp. KB-1 TaxID=2184575 RepID=UPI000DBECAD8|nr:alpha-amylase [Acetobacterium sp. KB-1]AWW27707.1 alpha-amylase [Acetobacterium sp. KB-1]